MEEVCEIVFDHADLDRATVDAISRARNTYFNSFAKLESVKAECIWKSGEEAVEYTYKFVIGGNESK